MPRWTAAARVLIALLGALSTIAQDGRPGLISFRRVAIPDDVPAHLCTAVAQEAGDAFRENPEEAVARRQVAVPRSDIG